MLMPLWQQGLRIPTASGRSRQRIRPITGGVVMMPVFALRHGRSVTMTCS